MLVADVPDHDHGLVLGEDVDTQGQGPLLVTRRPLPLHCVTFLVTEIATVLEGSDHAVAVIDLALTLVVNEPDHDLASGTGRRDCQIFSVHLEWKMSLINHIEKLRKMVLIFYNEDYQYLTFVICPLIFIVFFTIELLFYFIFSPHNHWHHMQSGSFFFVYILEFCC